MVRENSEGEYAGLGGPNLSGRGPGNAVAPQTALFTEKGCERIMRFSFDVAHTRAVKKVSRVVVAILIGPIVFLTIVGGDT